MHIKTNANYLVFRANNEHDEHTTKQTLVHTYIRRMQKLKALPFHHMSDLLLFNNNNNKKKLFYKFKIPHQIRSLKILCSLRVSPPPPTAYIFL